MRKILLYSLVICFVLLCNVAGGQFFSYQKYDVENSAAEGDILQVQQDHSGAMWWVNDEYFTRYNGINYTNVHYGDIAVSYQTTQPFIDTHGDLWLCASQKNKVDIYTHADNKWNKLTTIVLAVDEQAETFYATMLGGHPWVVITTANRMLAWENSNWEELPLDETHSIYGQHAGGSVIYTHTDAGLFITRHGKAPYKISENVNGMDSSWRFALYENIWLNGSEPELWVIAQNFIGNIQNNTIKVRKLLDNSSYGFVKLRNTGDGRVYLLTKYNELWQLDIKTKALSKLDGVSKNGVITETVNQLFTDREKNLWIAVEDGLIKTSRQNISFITKKKGLGSLPVQALASVGERVVAAGPRGISVYTPDGDIQYYAYMHPQLRNSRQNIRQIKGDTLGNVWMLSNSQGLWHTSNFTDWEQIAEDNTIAAFEITPRGTIYVASPSGLYEAMPQGLQFIAAMPDSTLPNNIVWHNNTLLLLSNNGVFKLSGKRWATLVQEDGGAYNVSTYALESVYDNLAILGTENGLYYLKEFDLVKYANDTIWGVRPYYGIAIDGNGAVWLASDTGVVVMEKRGAPKVYAYRGMQFKSVFNSPIIAGKGGEIYAGMRTGLMMYRADFMKVLDSKPLLHISSVETREVSKTNFNTSTVIALESADNDITFYFDANSFVDESKNKLLYTLEGYMSEWEEVTNLNENSVSFKNLPAGQYVLKMQLINANGVAGEIVSSPVIKISKPFYSQWWFYGAAILAFFGISFGIFYLYGQKKFENDLLQEVDKRSRELRSSEERFRTLWDNTSDALVLYNLRGEILLHNPTFLEVAGKSINDDNLNGQKLYEVLHIADEELAEKEFRVNLETQQLKPRFELKTLQKDSKEVVLEFSNTYLLLPNEKTWVMLSLLRNITQRKQTEENLIAAKNEAEQASRVKSAFLATMSHEIRTPLNAIIGMSSVMRNTQLSDEQRNYVSAIKTSSDSLLSLVNNILDFSKIEAGMMMIEKTEMQPEDSVNETLEILGNLANEKGIQLYARIHPDVPVKILSDKTRLRQVLINLVGNAIKFTEKGYIEIGIKPAPNHQLKVSVTDTGIGIPKSKINNLFKVFTQVDDSTTRKYGGTGLGLAITDKLVNLLGGHIKVASQEGKGSQFTFIIKDFSNGKYPERRGDKLQQLPDVKLAVVSPRKIFGHIFATFNDEHSIKTIAAKTLAELAEKQTNVNAILVDVETLRETTVPDALKGKTFVAVKRNLKQMPDAVANLLGVDEKHIINTPVNSLMYQQILKRVVSVKEDKPKVNKAAEIEKMSESLPLKVLVVDDNKVNLMMMQVIMKNLGYKVDFANNGKEAVAQCNENNYNLVFMDLQMPEMDGIEATKMIKSEKNEEDFPAIVALTANAFPEDKQACLEAGMVDFLPKPVTMETIRGVITKIFADELVS